TERHLGDGSGPSRITHFQLRLPIFNGQLDRCKQLDTPAPQAVRIKITQSVIQRKAVQIGMTRVRPRRIWSDPIERIPLSPGQQHPVVIAKPVVGKITDLIVNLVIKAPLVRINAPRKSASVRSFEYFAE